MVSARTTGVGVLMPFVSVTPGMLKGAAIGGQVQRGSELARAGRCADRGHPRAAVIGGRGAGAAVAGGGIDGDAGMDASRNASSTGSVYGWPPPEIEKLMTLTPSGMACWTAATESEVKQPRPGRRGT